LLGARNLIGTGGIGGAAVDQGELAFEPHANRVRRLGLGGAIGRGAIGGRALRKRAGRRSRKPDNGRAERPSDLRAHPRSGILLCGGRRIKRSEGDETGDGGQIRAGGGANPPADQPCRAASRRFHSTPAMISAAPTNTIGSSASP